MWTNNPYPLSVTSDFCDFIISIVNQNPSKSNRVNLIIPGIFWAIHNYILRWNSNLLLDFQLLISYLARPCFVVSHPRLWIFPSDLWISGRWKPWPAAPNIFCGGEHKSVNIKLWNTFYTVCMRCKISSNCLSWKNKNNNEKTDLMPSTMYCLPSSHMPIYEWQHDMWL